MVLVCREYTIYKNGVQFIRMKLDILKYSISRISAPIALEMLVNINVVL